jgi:biopolymer transport protein ExbD
MFRRPSDAADFDLNLAPLVDVMMCLIIFFMLTGKLAQRERTPVELPRSEAARSETADGSRRFIVNAVDAAGEAQYRIGGDVLPLDALSERMAVEAKRDPDVSCYIRADRRLEYGHVEPILIQCRRAGIRRVTFATTAGRGTEGG